MLCFYGVLYKLEKKSIVSSNEDGGYYGVSHLFKHWLPVLETGVLSP